MENTPYFTAITDDRSIRHFADDEESSLDGSQLVSLETDPASGREEDIFTFVTDHFDRFLELIRLLKTRDQELLLSYYSLRKSQALLGPIFGMSQTQTSFNLRMCVKVLGALITFGGMPTADQMRPVFEAAGVEEQQLNKLYRGSETIKISLSQLVSDYMRYRSFAVVADRRGLHRPEVRRAMRRVGDMLREEDKPASWQALGAFIFILIDKANPYTAGTTNRQTAKEGDVHRVDPKELGDFRVKIGKDDPLLDELFAPHGIQ